MTGSLYTRRAHPFDTPVYVLLLAAGRGARFGADQNKCFIDLAGRSILRRAYEAFVASDLVSGIAVVVSLGEETTAERLLEPVVDHRFMGFVAGGVERQDSVLNGLSYLGKAPDGEEALVVVHDGARCLVRPDLIDTGIELARRFHVGVAPAVAVKDTIRSVDPNGRIDARPDRARLRAMQTPQIAPLDILKFAYEVASRQAVQVTDDLSALEVIGYPVRLIEGDPSNIKITTREDFDLARIWLDRLK